MILGITEKDMRDKNLIKVIDGIAGSAKSSSLFRFFGVDGVGRYTSTNRLKNDAAARYGGRCDTIAGGLFNTEKGRFYASLKDPEDETVIIDEFLQSDPCIFDWAGAYVGKCNIIMCTDSRQMLAPEAEGRMMAAYGKFIKRTDVIRSEPAETFRPRDDETKAFYNACWRMVDSDGKAFDDKRHAIGSIPDDYDPDAVYITHSKAAEKYVYDKYGLYDRYDADIIPKGTIARKPPKNKEKWPILPQSMAEQHSGYWQIANIATPTRYQGSECKGYCYYVIEKGSVISNREYYTVISRMFHVKQLVICYIDRQSDIEPKTYNGKPIKQWRIGKADPMVEIRVGCEMKTLADIISESGDAEEIYTSEENIEMVTRELKADSESVPRPDCFLCEGRIFKIKRQSHGNHKTMKSLLRREGIFNLPYTQKAYMAIEGVKIGIHGPFCKKAEKGKKRDQYKYGIDLKAAYPHALLNGTFPNASGDIGDPGLSFYMVRGENEVYQQGAVISEACADWVDDKKFLFSTPCQVGSKMGEWLHEQAHRSVESAKRIKDIHYGYLEKQYFERSEWDGHEYKSYCRDENNDHSLVMAAIRSEICNVMCTIREAIYGSQELGFINVDCLYFDYAGDVTEIGEKLKGILPDWDFRIFENTEEKNELYRTYEELKTEAELKKIRRRKK